MRAPRFLTKTLRQQRLMLRAGVATQRATSNRAGPLALLVGIALASLACGSGDSEGPVATLEARNAALEQRIAALEETIEQLAADAPPDTVGDEGMDMTMTNGDEVQEFSIIENYAATRFYPEWMVVLKDVPVRMYLTRLHREHVNQFSIDPFYKSAAVILPGEIGLIEFIPSEVGLFKIRNVGHGFEASLVVVETHDEARRLVAERGRQMFSLIHSVDDFRIFPDRLVLQEGIPARIHNISLVGEHQVSFGPFEDPDDINVKPREISILDFTPADRGEFTIKHELHGFTGELIVE